MSANAIPSTPFRPTSSTLEKREFANAALPKRLQKKKKGSSKCNRHGPVNEPNSSAIRKKGKREEGHS
jgi:hypothetical protein